jgi:hypothetical protein
VSDLSLDESIAEIEEISWMLDRDRRRSDPARGVICVLGCAERPCAHPAHLVARILRDEEEDA